MIIDNDLHLALERRNQQPDSLQERQPLFMVVEEREHDAAAEIQNINQEDVND
jgi:hypothetical protein